MIDNELIEMIKDHEGTKKKNGRHVLYKCTAGKWTIGYGVNLENGISDDIAEYMLIALLREKEEDLVRNIKFWDELPVSIKRVLMDMCYNLGISRLLGFKKTLAFLEKGDYVNAAKEMLDSKWAKQVGRRALRLSQIVAKAAINR